MEGENADYKNMVLSSGNFYCDDEILMRRYDSQLKTKQDSWMMDMFTPKKKKDVHTAHGIVVPGMMKCTGESTLNQKNIAVTTQYGNTCVAHSTYNMINYIIASKSNLDLRLLDHSQLFNKIRMDYRGSTNLRAMKYMFVEGVSGGDSTVVKIALPYRLDSSLQTVKSVIAHGLPVIATIKLYETMLEEPCKTDGVVLEQHGDSLGYHSVMIYGFDDDSKEFKFVNSWGKDVWTKSGMGSIAYGYKMRDCWTTNGVKISIGGKDVKLNILRNNVALKSLIAANAIMSFSTLHDLMSDSYCESMFSSTPIRIGNTTKERETVRQPKTPEEDIAFSIYIANNIRLRGYINPKHKNNDDNTLYNMCQGCDIYASEKQQVPEKCNLSNWQATYSNVRQTRDGGFADIRLEEMETDEDTAAEVQLNKLFDTSEMKWIEEGADTAIEMVKSLIKFKYIIALIVSHIKKLWASHDVDIKTKSMMLLVLIAITPMYCVMMLLANIVNEGMIRYNLVKMWVLKTLPVRLRSKPQVDLAAGSKFIKGIQEQKVRHLTVVTGRIKFKTETTVMDSWFDKISGYMIQEYSNRQTHTGSNEMSVHDVYRQVTRNPENDVIVKDRETDSGGKPLSEEAAESMNSKRMSSHSVGAESSIGLSSAKPQAWSMDPNSMFNRVFMDSKAQTSL